MKWSYLKANCDVPIANIDEETFFFFILCLNFCYIFLKFFILEYHLSVFWCVKIVSILQQMQSFYQVVPSNFMQLDTDFRYYILLSKKISLPLSFAWLNHNWGFHVGVPASIDSPGWLYVPVDLTAARHEMTFYPSQPVSLYHLSADAPLPCAGQRVLLLFGDGLHTILVLP